MEAKFKHLEFVQNAIIRFNNNCFLIKGWSVTLVAALFALAAKDADARYVIITYLSTAVFWLLDAYYLSQERQYRRLYDDVASRNESTVDFSMKANHFGRGRCSWAGCLIAGTLTLFYGVLVIASLLVFLTLTNVEPNV